MAKIVMMKHEKTGVVKKGFYGFSWTSFFFGGFPALFRGDIVTGLIILFLGLLLFFLLSLLSTSNFMRVCFLDPIFQTAISLDISGVGLGCLVFGVSFLLMLPGYICMGIWAFIYNKRYTLHLLEQGYQFCDTPAIVTEAKMKLGIPTDTQTSGTPEEHRPS